MAHSMSLFQLNIIYALEVQVNNVPILYNFKYCCRFLIGDNVPGSGSVVGGSGESGKSPWVYISMDGQVQSCKLYVYSVSHNAVLIIIIYCYLYVRSCV